MAHSTTESQASQRGGRARLRAQAASIRAGVEAPRLWVSFAHLAALWTLACVWPLFHLLSDNAEFFIARGNTRVDVLIFAFGFALGPPLALALIVWLVGRLRAAAGWWLRVGLVGALVAILAFGPAGDALGGSTVPGAVLAVVLGAIAAFVYARFEAARSITTVLSIAPVGALVLFLAFSPVSKVVMSTGSDTPVAPGVRSSTPVVWINFDELPAISLMNSSGRIDARRMPSFARLARDATWYRNATTVADETMQAIPALLSGDRPRPGELPTAQDHPHNLFTMLGGRYRFDVVEPVTDLCPTDLCHNTEPQFNLHRMHLLASDLAVVEGRLLAPAHLRNRLPATDRNWQGFAASGAGTQSTPQSAAAQRFMSRFAATDPMRSLLQFSAGLQAGGARPQLDFVHLLFPHVPWHYFPDGQQYNDPGIPGLLNEKWDDNPTLVNLGWQRHLLQAADADRALGQILQRLRASGIYDRALIVAVADHGVSFRPGEPRRPVTRRNFPEIANPPLLVKMPHQQRGRIDDAPVRTIDILPTIASALRIALPRSWRFDGAPFAADVPARRRVTVKSYVGGSVTQPFATFVRERDARLAYQSRLLGRRDDPYAIGTPDPALLGRPVSGLRTAARREGAAMLDDAGALANVDPRAPVVPAYLSGGASGIAAGTPLALALNGRIAATTRAYAQSGVVRFAALVPPASMRAGPNALRVYEIVRGGALAPLAGGAAPGSTRYALREGAGGVRLRGPSGPLPVSKGAARGFVDHAGITGGLVTLGGWAAAQDLHGAADQVVVFAGDRLVAAGAPHQPRPDLVKIFHLPGAILRSGFTLTVPASALRCSEADGGLRAFAIRGRRASPLGLNASLRGVVRTACAR